MVEVNDALNLVVLKRHKAQQINARHTAEVGAVSRTDVLKVQRALRIGVWLTAVDGVVPRRAAQKALLGKQESVKPMAVVLVALTVSTGLIPALAPLRMMATVRPASSVSSLRTHGAKSFMLTQRKYE
jgi:hypothetical protein